MTTDRLQLAPASKPRRTAVVGGGAGFRQLLRLLEKIAAEGGAVPLEVVAVADPNPEAPGLVYAREKGLATAADYREVLALEGLELVLELTGRAEVAEALRREVPPGVAVVDHRAARLMWDLIQVQEGRLARARQAAHVLRLGAVEEMATYIAHEVRNPLVSIGGFAQSLISADCLKDEPCLKRARIILDESRRLEGVLKDIWDLTRPLVIQKEAADFNQVVGEALDLLRPEWEAAGVKAELDLDPDIGSSRFDPHLVKQACLNIFKNAGESMPEGGTLSVETGLEWGRLLLRCQDQGSGIAAEAIENVYNPFFTTKKGALGLGLAMTKKIIEDHGGEIRVTSDKGRGTLVEFSLPLEKA